jgi:type I restriction enzyme S subunit
MSFPRYPAYKYSGVEWLGEVPAHWQVKRLRNVAMLNPSKSEVAHLPRDTEVSFLPMEAVGDDGTLNLDRTRPIGDVESGYTYFREGDVTIAKITPCFENGKGAVMRSLHNRHGFGTTELIVVRPTEGKTTSDYLHLLFTSHPFRLFGEASMYGAGGQKRVSDDFVRDFAAAFPPPEEQTAIATVLDHETAKIDALVAEQERLIELLKEKRQAVISHAVTKGLDPFVPMKDSGVEWLGEVPAHWEVTALKRHWSITDCKHVTAEFVEEGYALASIREVQSRWVELEQAKQTTEYFYQLLIEGERNPQSGDLIFSRNATVGEVAQVHTGHPPFAMGQDVVLMRRIEKHFNPDFLQLVLRSEVVVQQLALCMIGSTFKRINVEEIRSLVIAFPPPAEQHLIATYLLGQTEGFDELIAEALLSIELLRERRTALISAAVSGQIDVRGWVPLEVSA